MAVVCGLFVLGWIWSSPSAGQSLDNLQFQREQILQQLQDVQVRSSALRLQENQARSQLEELQSDIELTDTRIEDNIFRLKRAQQILTELEAKLDVSEAKLEKQQNTTGARLRFLQKQGQERWWALLLGSKDLNQFFDRRYYIKLLLDSDRKLIRNMQETALNVEQERVAMEAQKNEIALLTQKLAAQKSEMQLQASAQEVLVNRLQTERAAYEAAQQRLESDSQQISTLIQELTITQTQGAQGTGQMQLPISNAPISSGFGWRVHPIFGTSRLHTGIDFAVASGTPVGAADSGTVLLAGWYGGYGYTIVISHGSDLTTLYGHNSDLLVQQGQTVGKGEPVALSGSTGFSTGPHVHFEVRKGGVPVDPMGYM
jgi:murein DD-endopeptidase MepM/ murein hydrolase activator NlpD